MSAVLKRETENKTAAPNNIKRRYAWIDALRGFAVINMIAYHAIWDLVYMFDLPWSWFVSDGVKIWQQAICWTFILLSGFCASLGKKNIKRAAVVLLAGTVVSVVSYIAVPDNVIIFGVLTLIGSCMLIAYFAEKLIERIPAPIGLAASMMLFFTMRNVPKGTLGFGDLVICTLPEFLYRNIITAYLGFPQSDFQSADYFPLIPWMFLFFAGCFIGILLRGKLKYSKLRKQTLLEWIGKNALVIYIIHQPAIYLILSIISCFGLLK